MTTLRQRNLRILRMRETGATYRDLAAMFGLSQASIGVIVHRLEAERGVETDLDLGKRSNEYWGKRWTWLTRCSRIRRASPYAWSKPCKLPWIE